MNLPNLPENFSYVPGVYKRKTIICIKFDNKEFNPEFISIDLRDRTFWLSQWEHDKHKEFIFAYIGRGWKQKLIKEACEYFLGKF